MGRRGGRLDLEREARASRFASQLADALAELDLTHQQIAQALGIPRYTVDSWTRAADAKIPGSHNLGQLCTLLEQRKAGLGRALAATAGLAWTPVVTNGAATASTPAAGLSTAPPARPQTPAADPTRTNLPLALTSFIGRERELREIQILLRSGEFRLLTLTGPGGVGKTRLALQAGAGLLPAFPDGIWLVELALLGDPDLVPQAVAATLGVREQPGGQLLPTLIAALRAQRVLLVLDNCEHLISACATLAFHLLRACPQLTLLTTSREALRLPGEVVWPVPALALPALEEPPLATLAATDTVSLFLDRAQASRPGFALTAPNAAAVMQICRRLDGLPLAIELAAATLRLLTVEQIAARLDNRFRLLLGGSRMTLPQHQTLQATIDWSYDLLTAPERTLFQQLGVFAGSWTLEAAEAVYADAGGEAADVYLVLARLVDQSLVIVEEQDGAARYRLLESIREYARTKLRDAAAYERMAAYFIAYVERHASDYDLLERELPNIVATLQGAFDQGSAGALVRGANAFYHFLETRGLYDLAAILLDRAEQAARGSADPAALVTTLLHRGRLAERHGNFPRAEACYEEGLALARTTGHAAGISALLQNLGAVAIRRGDDSRAESFLLEGLTLARDLGDAERISALLGNLAAIAVDRSAYAQAETYYQESLALARTLGNRERISALLQGLGVTAVQRGDYAPAEAYLHEGLALARAIGHRERLSHLLVNLGAVATCRGDYARAEGILREGLALARSINNPECISHLLEKLAELAHCRGDDGPAAAYAQEGLALARTLGHRKHTSALLKIQAVITANQGDYTQAEADCAASLALARALGRPRLVSQILNEAGDLQLRQQQAAAGAAAFAEALALARGVGSPDLAARALYGLARVAAAQGDPPAARRQGEESHALFAAIGHYQAATVRRWLDALPADAPVHPAVLLTP